ncbi:hypothetical protein HHI36_004338 [Cryptolaemus montrouzieri]|uniref:Uncharacterized protein n=1 Tax=Cryptolaemus montrouzieri TaxID=559131 RepID=A0ABD2NQW4_9CUCU
MPRTVTKGSNTLHSINQTICKNKKKITKRTVKKMIAIMNPPQDQPSTSSDPSPVNPNNVEDFLSTGRTGRRNALPDILSDYSLVTSSELPTQLEALTTKDNLHGIAGLISNVYKPCSQTIIRQPFLFG